MTKPLLLTLLMAVAAMGQPTQDPHMPEIGQCWECKWDVLDHELVWIVPQTSDTNYVAFRGVNGMLFNNTWTVSEFRWQWHWISDPINATMVVTNNITIGKSHKGLIWESNQIAISLEYTNTITVGSNVYRVKDGMLEQVGPPAKWWSEIDEIKAPTAFHLDYVRDDVSHGLTWEYAFLTNEAAPNGDATNLLVDFYHSRFRPVPIQWATNRHLIGEFNFGFTISNAIGEGTYSNEYAVLTWRGEKHTNWLDRTKYEIDTNHITIGQYQVSNRMTVVPFKMTGLGDDAHGLTGVTWIGLSVSNNNATTNDLVFTNGKPAEPITTNWEYDGYRAELWKPHRAGLMFPEIIFDHLEVLQHCQREQGYTSDGRVVWRTPPEVGGGK